MPRNYSKVKHLLAEVLELKSEGKTHAEIADFFGLTKVQVKKLVERHNRAQRRTQEEIPTVTSRRGRPRKTPLTPRQELERENKQLQMEVALLRSFLRAAGRR